MKPTHLLLTCWIALAGTLASLAQPIVQFTAASYSVAENVGQATLSVEPTADLDTPVSVDFVTTDGSAIGGLKYEAASGKLTFGAGETQKRILVPILNNGPFCGASKEVAYQYPLTAAQAPPIGPTKASCIFRAAGKET